MKDVEVFARIEAVSRGYGEFGQLEGYRHVVYAQAEDGRRWRYEHGYVEVDEVLRDEDGFAYVINRSEADVAAEVETLVAAAEAAGSEAFSSVAPSYGSAAHACEGDYRFMEEDERGARGWF